MQGGTQSRLVDLPNVNNWANYRKKEKKERRKQLFECNHFHVSMKDLLDFSGLGRVKRATLDFN